MKSESKKLEREYQLFEKNRKEWFREHPGQYVVIRSNDVAGFFDDYSTAFKAALKHFGVSSDFLIQQVCAHEKVFVIY